MREEQELRRIRQVKDWSLTEAAQKMGTSADQLSKLERGERGLTVEWLNRALDAYQMTHEEFYGGNPVELPFYGEIPGGQALAIQEPDGEKERIVSLLDAGILNGQTVIEIPKPKPNSFAMRVRGQSMNLVAPEGHYLIVNPNLPPLDELDNKLVVASVNGDCTFKRFGYNPLRLEPLSTDYEFRAQFFEPDEIRIVGVVELILKDLR